MIQIIDKQDCCGCGACVQSCPKQCISFIEDEQGFVYPLVDETLCVECGLCEKVCPILHQDKEKQPQKVYAAQNRNEEVRMTSSSGGVFTLLAEAVIKAGGVVFGAQFDKNWEVEHAYTETIEGLVAFRSSKYVQSRTGTTFIQVKQFLQAGRVVLYSGTSCQIAGLRHFLRKEYDNLLTIDVICHGVPSPLVWRTYLHQVLSRPKGVAGKNLVLSSLNDLPVITGISFRDKTKGWKKFGFVLSTKSASKADKNMVSSSVKTNSYSVEWVHEVATKNYYMQLFLKNLCLRPSCAKCPAKSGTCGSDISLADYWGIWFHHPKWDDNKGTSLVLVNTSKGQKWFDQLSMVCKETSYQEALAGNSAIEKSVAHHPLTDAFWQCFLQHDDAGIERLLKSTQPQGCEKWVMLFKDCVRWMIPQSFLNKLHSRSY